MRITHALRCTTVIATSAAGVAFWATNLFASQASLDAYRADTRVLAADKAKATLLTQAVATALGITNAVATTNPPGTVTLRDGTLGYGAHNFRTRSQDFGDASWLKLSGATGTNGTIDPNGGATAYTLNAGAGYLQAPGNAVTGMAAGVLATESIWIKASSAVTASIAVADSNDGTPSYSYTPSLTTSWQRFSFLYTGTAASSTFLTIQISQHASAQISVAFSQCNLGPTALDYVPTTAAAVYAPRLSFDRGATQNMLLNSATLSTQTVTVVSGQVYTISALGTGSVALSSGGAGTLTCSATLRNQLTFTASGTSVVCTVTGSVLQANFNPGYATNYLATAGAILYTAGTPRSQNLHTASADVTSWTRSATTLTGTQTVLEDATSALHNIQSNVVPVTAGCVYTFRVRIKPVGRTDGVIRCAQAPMGDVGVKIDFAAVTVAALNSVFGQTITGPDAAGFYTITWRGVAASSGTSGYYYASCNGVSPNANGTVHAGDITKGVTIDSVWCYEGTADLAYVATTGTAYSEYPSLEIVREVGRTRETLQPRDLTNASWTKSGSITATKNQTGVDGVANSCCSLTATGSSYSAILTQAVISASANRVLSCYVRALTTNPIVQLSCDGGVTSTPDIVVGPQWQRISWPTASVTNPSYKIYLKTTGDSIAVDFVQGEQGLFPTSPIWGTESASVTRSDDLIRPPTSYINDTAQTTVMEIVVTKIGGTQQLMGRAGNGNIAYIGGSGAPAMSDGTVAVALASTVSDGIAARVATRYSAAGQGISLNGAAVSTGAFDGTMGTSASTVGIGDDGAGGNGFTGGIRRIAIKSSAANDADLQLAAAGGR